MPLKIQLAQNKNWTKIKALLVAIPYLYMCAAIQKLYVFFNRKTLINSLRKTCDYLVHSDSVLP